MRHTLFKILALFFIAYSSAQNVDISGNVQDESGLPILMVISLLQVLTLGQHYHLVI